MTRRDFQHLWWASSLPPFCASSSLIQSFLECIELYLLVLVAQPLENIHQVLVVKLLVKVCTHVPHAPPTLQIYPWKWLVFPLL